MGKQKRLKNDYQNMRTVKYFETLESNYFNIDVKFQMITHNFPIFVKSYLFWTDSSIFLLEIYCFIQITESFWINNWRE